MNSIETGGVELSVEVRKAFQGGFLERWRENIKEFVRDNQRSETDSFSLIHNPELYYHISRLKELKFQETLPDIIATISDKFVAELSKGSAGSLKAIPNFLDDEDFNYMYFPPHRSELIELIHKSMTAHGIARNSIAALPFLKLCMTSIVTSGFNALGLNFD